MLADKKDCSPTRDGGRPLRRAGYVRLVAASVLLKETLYRRVNRTTVSAFKTVQQGKLKDEFPDA